MPFESQARRGRKGGELRVLVVDTMRPDDGAPQRGSFVRDQVAALRAIGVDVEHVSFPPGAASYPRTAARLRPIVRDGGFEIVHAHFGLTGWCALLAGARPLVVTFHGTDVRHPVTGLLSRRLAPRVALAAGASRALFRAEAGRPALPHRRGSSAVLPTGVDLERFRPMPRADARRRLGLDPGGRYLLFPAAPRRRVKRYDRAQEIARLTGAELLVAGDLEPGSMPALINAAAAVLITSDNEGFGLAALEALACDVAVLATPVGIAPTLLRGLEGSLCSEFDAESWASRAREHLDTHDPRVDGRRRARRLSAELMARRAAAAYRELLGRAKVPAAGRQ